LEKDFVEDKIQKTNVSEINIALISFLITQL